MLEVRAEFYLVPENHEGVEGCFSVIHSSLSLPDILAVTLEDIHRLWDSLVIHSS